MDNLTIGFILIGVAFVLAVAEVLLPTGGALLVAAGIADLIGIVMVFTYGDPYMGFVTLVAEAIVLPILVALTYFIWPHTPMGRRLIMGTAADETLATISGRPELELLRGRIGKAVSVLRPAGAVEFDGRRYDCLSEGVLIEPDTWVRCVDVKGAKVIVRPLEHPPDLSGLEEIRYD